LLAGGLLRGLLVLRDHGRISCAHPASGQAANHSNSETVIRCLTIGIQDAGALYIALELIMLGRPPRYPDERIKQATTSPVGLEARP
jgi:hypothetical protein